MIDNTIPAKKRYLAEENFASSIKKHKETLDDEDVDHSDSATKISFDYISLNLPSLQPQVVLHCLMEDAMTRNTNTTMVEQVTSESCEKHSPSDMRQLRQDVIDLTNISEILSEDEMSDATVEYNEVEELEKINNYYKNTEDKEEKKRDT